MQANFPNATWLVGALAMRRATYRELGGVRGAAICGGGAYDDMGWSKLVRASGRASRMVYHPALEDDSNWESFPEFWEGITRWAAGVFTYRSGGWLVAAICSAAIGLSLAGFLVVVSAVLHGRVPGLLPSILAAALPTAGTPHCIWNRWPLAGAFAFYGVGVEALATLAGGAWARARNRVSWRGEVVKVSAPPPERPAAGSSPTLG